MNWFQYFAWMTLISSSVAMIASAAYVYINRKKK